MSEVSYRGAATIDYKHADLSELKYIKIVYNDIDGNTHEFKTEKNFLSDIYMSLYVKRVLKKGEEPEDEKEEQQEEETSASYCTSNYLKKLAEIRTAKEKAEATGNYSEYYKKLAELSAEKAVEESVKPRNEEHETVKSEETQPEAQNENAPLETKELNEEDEAKQFNIPCPQKVKLKFVIKDLLYVSEAELIEVTVKPSRVYFKIRSPKILNFEQNRKFYRIIIQSPCVVIATDKEGASDIFVARVMNFSAGGVLVNRLETLTEDKKYITINPESYDRFNLIIIHEPDKIVKLAAKYVREEEGSNSQRYAFEFADIGKEKTDSVNKYVIAKQVEKLKKEFDMKNKNYFAKQKENARPYRNGYR